jgi:hypothetical protein
MAWKHNMLKIIKYIDKTLSKNYFLKNCLFIIKRFLKSSKENNYVYYKKINCCFVAIPKNASSSINSILLKKARAGNLEINYDSVHELKYKYLISKREFNKLNEEVYIFTFTRNPFDRLISCYKNKIQNENYLPITENYFGLFRKTMSFKKFINVVCVIPDKLSDKHFKSQYSIMYPNIWKKNKYSHIGKVENLDKDIEVLVKEIGLEKPIKMNSTGNTGYKLSDWYTDKMMKKVYKRYKKDFDKLNYRNDFNI